MVEGLVPEENIRTYCFIYCIENALRELIIDELEVFGGKKWYKLYLPADVLEKFKKGKEIEKSIKWVQLFPSHPIYYIDFSDLKKIILRGDCWKNVFKNIFNREEIINGIFAEIDNIRNKVAHNRRVTNSDSTIVSKSYEEIKSCIGDIKFKELLNRYTFEPCILEKINKLKDESIKLYQICKPLKPLKDFKYWDEISNSWWFDEIYLNYKIKNIYKLFETLKEYSNLPRLRGVGNKIESWVINSGIELIYNKSQKEFSNLLESIGGNKDGIK